MSVHPHAPPRGREGFTLIEVLVAMTVVLVGAMSAMTLIEKANAATVTTRSREGATNLAREVVEAVRGVPFAAMVPGTLEGRLQGGQPPMPDDSSTSGWQVRRRGFLYTVTTDLCTMDDPRDGGGAQDSGSFCSDSAAANAPSPLTGSVDRSPEDYKRVRVTVAWTHRNVPRRVQQTTIVNNPGSASGPAVRTLTSAGLDGGPAPGWVAAPTTSLAFGLTTSRTPATLRWLIDGSPKGPITAGSALSWSFTWELGAVDDPAGVADGVYLIGAEAFDSYGVAGPSRSVTVTVNRSLPDQVKGFTGGVIADPSDPAREIVDLAWLAGSERDIIGYEVLRLAPDGTRTVVCPRQEATQCQDPAPPVTGALDYVVRAYDRASPTVVRAGPDSDVLTVTRTNQAPYPPTALSATRNADGSTTLQWRRPDPADPDSGDTVAFYRIYRDGLATANRYARWDDPSTAVTFIDSATGGQSHSYWVTAVDTRLGESLPIGPVSG